MKYWKHGLAIAGLLVIASQACAEETTPPHITATTKDNASLTVDEQKECMKLFEKIITIQEERNKKTDEISVIIKMREQKAISKKKFFAFYKVWIDNENRLAGEVNKLYQIGDLHGCFKEIKEIE